MKLDRPLRVILAVAVVIGLLLVLLALLMLTNSVLDVWQRLSEAPRWVVAVWLMVIGVLSLLAGWAVLRLLFAGRTTPNQGQPLDEAGLRARLDHSEASGVDVSAARHELELLDQRRAAGDFRVALFGEISTGKTALIRALVPEGDSGEISVRGGSTRTLTDYCWVSPAGDRLILTDVPGLNEADGVLDQTAKDEAQRAHAVVFVCDDDLTRDEFQSISDLSRFDKPMIIALNKADQLNADDATRVTAQIAAQLQSIENGNAAQVVAVSAAPRHAVLRQLTTGQQEKRLEHGPPQVDRLREALQQVMDRDPILMEGLRDASVFMLASRHLELAESEYRAARAKELVTSYTRKAIVGALAAVAPGTDVLIQGYLGANLVRELCELYGISPRDIDVQQFLKLSQAHVGKAMPLLMAIGGNALKAFPGAGTVAGGLMHAVAYGLIFDALGRSLSVSLSDSGRLRPVPAASQFRKLLSENLEKRTASMAKIALDASRQRNDS